MSNTAGDSRVISDVKVPLSKVLSSMRVCGGLDVCVSVKAVVLWIDTLLILLAGVLVTHQNWYSSPNN